MWFGSILTFSSNADISGPWKSIVRKDIRASAVEGFLCWTPRRCFANWLLYSPSFSVTPLLCVFFTITILIDVWCTWHYLLGFLIWSKLKFEQGFCRSCCTCWSVLFQPQFSPGKLVLKLPDRLNCRIRSIINSFLFHYSKTRYYR